MEGREEYVIFVRFASSETSDTSDGCLKHLPCPNQGSINPNNLRGILVDVLGFSSYSSAGRGLQLSSDIQSLVTCFRDYAITHRL